MCNRGKNRQLIIINYKWKLHYNRISKFNLIFTSILVFFPLLLLLLLLSNTAGLYSLCSIHSFIHQPRSMSFNVIFFSSIHSIQGHKYIWKIIIIFDRKNRIILFYFLHIYTIIIIVIITGIIDNIGSSSKYKNKTKQKSKYKSLLTKCN